MEYYYFKDANLLVLENEGKCSLYRLDEDQNIIPLAWAQNQKRLDVRPEYNLVVTDNTIYTLTGDIVFSSIGNYEIFFTPMRCNLLLQLWNMSSAEVYLLWWDGQQKVENVFGYNHIYWNDDYVITQKDSHNLWEIYADGGQKIEIDNIRSDEAHLVGHFLIVDGLGQHMVYHLQLKTCLKSDQQRIVASPNDDFVMCCTISGNLQIWYHGEWREFGTVENFGLLSEDFGVFYVVKGGRYYIYNFDGKPFLNTIYPNGFDYVGYDSENLRCILVNDGKARFFI